MKLKILVHLQNQTNPLLHSVFLFNVEREYGIIRFIKLDNSLQNKKYAVIIKIIKDNLENVDYILSTTNKLVNRDSIVSEYVPLTTIPTTIISQYLSILPLLGTIGQELEEGNGLKITNDTLHIDRYFVTNTTYAIFMLLQQKSRHVELLNTYRDEVHDDG